MFDRPARHGRLDTTEEELEAELLRQLEDMPDVAEKGASARKTLRSLEKKR